MSAQYNVKPNPAIRMSGALTEPEKAEITKLLAEGKSVADTARAVGVGASTVSRYRKINGLSAVGFNNTAGTQAYSRDAATRRAKRMSDMDKLWDLRHKKIIDVLEGRDTWKTFQKIGGGAEVEVDLTWIPSQDLRSEVTSFGVLDTATNRNDDRADDGGQARARSMLDMIIRGIANAVVTVPDDQAVFEE